MRSPTRLDQALSSGQDWTLIATGPPSTVALRDVVA